MSNIAGKGLDAVIEATNKHLHCLYDKPALL